MRSLVNVKRLQLQAVVLLINIEILYMILKCICNCKSVIFPPKLKASLDLQIFTFSGSSDESKAKREKKG